MKKQGVPQDFFTIPTVGTIYMVVVFFSDQEMWTYLLNIIES